MVNEAARLAALRALSILDTPPEERFDRVTRLARRLFDVPICLISLIDEERQWFKSCLGLGATETPRSQAFCAYAIQQEAALVVPDATQDERFRDNPLVTGEPHIRFYAGHPMFVNGQGMGTLCVIDRHPRTFSDEDRAALADLAHVAEQELNAGKLGEALDLYQQSERFYRELFEQSPAYMLLVGPDGTISQINEAVREALGDVVGAPLANYVELPTAPSGTVQVGSAVWACTVWKRPGQLLIHALDITQRAALEQAKQQFLSIASHELRTPVTSLRGSLLVLNQGIGGLQPDARRLVEMALRGAERLYAMTEDMVLLTSLTLGADLGSETVPVTELGFEGDLTVQAHKASLQRVTRHLLGNAAKFPPMVTTCEAVDGGVQFSITDRGPGLSEAESKAVFTRFSSLEEADKRTRGGLGLGLALCRQVVESHGGRLWVESELGKGTYVSFMAAELSKVLVVDDDDDMRDLAELSLAQFGGMEVQVAKDYEQALQTLAVWTPDLVLCDVMMPNVSGPELLRMIRERWTVPVVFLTARASLSDASRYKELGAAGVLAKPFDPMTLTDEVRKVFAAGT